MGNLNNKIDRKFIETYDVNDFEVLTNDGFKDIKKTNKTISYEIWELTLENNIYLKCADNHIIYSNNKEIYIKDLKIGQYIDTKYGLKKVLNIKPLNYKEEMYDLTVEDEKYYTNDILSHNTTTIASYVIWYSIFNKDKQIGIVSNKVDSAKDILSRIQIMYEELPKWIKPGVKEYAKKSVTFENGSKIMISSTSPTSFRGRTLNCLICDEFAFVPANQCEAFWASNYQTISASKNSKVIIISTPCGMFNLFHRLYAGAKKGTNGFVSHKVTWKDIPGRTLEWAKKEKERLGSDLLFRQEQACEFIGSVSTLIDSTVLKTLLNLTKQPEYYDLNNKFKIYKKPEKDSIYVLGVDVSKGTGGDYSVIQVLKINNFKPFKLEQVAIYRNNEIEPYLFAEIVNRIGLYYNNAYIMCENNDIGSVIVNELWYEYENMNLVNFSLKKNDKELGIRATRSTKPKACTLLKKIIESGDLKIVDEQTINELADFIEEKGKYFGKSLNDDTVTSLYWAIFIFETGILSEELKLTKSIPDMEEGWGILSEVEQTHENWDWFDNQNIYN